MCSTLGLYWIRTPPGKGHLDVFICLVDLSPTPRKKTGAKQILSEWMKYHLCLQFYALVEEIIVHLRHKVRDLCKALWDPRKEKKLGLWGHQSDPQTDSLLSLLRHPGPSVLPTLSGALLTPFLTLSPGRAPSVCQTKSPWHTVPAARAAHTPHARPPSSLSQARSIHPATGEPLSTLEVAQG